MFELRRLLAFLVWLGFLGAVLVNSGCVAYEAPPVRFKKVPTEARMVWRVGNEGGVASLAFHPDGKRVVFGMQNGEVELWTMGRTKADWVTRAKGSEVTSVDVAGDGKVIAVSSSENRSLAEAQGRESTAHLQLIRVDTGEVLMTESTGDKTFGVRFTSDSRSLVNYGKDICIRRVEDLHAVWEYRSKEWWLQTMFAVPTGNTLCIWDPEHLWVVRDSQVALVRSLRKEERFMASPPQLLSDDGAHAFDSRGAAFGDELLPMVLREAGILSGPLNERPTEFLILEGKGQCYPSCIAYMAATKVGDSDWLVASLMSGLDPKSNKNGVVLMDLRGRTYQSLLPEGTQVTRYENCPIAVSKEGRMVAVGGPWGVAVWEVPGR